MARNTVYSVIFGINGGYLPNEIVYFATKRDAQSYMVENAQSLREDGYMVYGSARKGGYEYIPSDASKYHIGSYIEMETIEASQIASDNDLTYSSIGDLVDQLNDLPF